MKTPKNHWQLPRIGRAVGVLPTLLLWMAGGFNLLAATDTWTGAGGDAIWSDPSNWSGVNTPPATGDTPTFGTVGAGGATLNNDWTTPTSYLGLAFNANAPAFTLNGGSIATTGGILDNSTSLETINLAISMTSTHTFGVVSGGAMTLGGVLSGTGGGITKTGGGLLTVNGVNGANTYTGATAANGGTLELDFTQGGSTPAANIISSSSALALGGGTLLINGSATTASSQTFASLTVNAGDSVISETPSSGSSSPTISLAGFTDNTGGAVEFVGPAYNSGASSGTTMGGTLVAATAVIKTTSGTVNAAYTTAGGYYATVNLYDWAIATGTTPFTIAGASQDASFYTVINSGKLSTASANYDVTGTTTAESTTTTLGSVRLNANAAITLNTGSSGSQCGFGGLLVTPNVGANNDVVAGYFIVSRSSSNVLHIWQNNTLGFLQITGTYNDSKSGTGILVQNGPGTMVMGTGQGYSNVSYLNNGVTEITADSCLGVAADAETIYLNGGTILGNATFTMDNSGANLRPLSLGNNGGGLAAVTGDVMSVDGAISGAGLLTIGIPASSANGNTAGLLAGTGAGTANTTAVYATGTVLLDNSSGNSFTGGALITAGATLNINSEWQLGGSVYGGLTFNNGTLLYNSTLLNSTTDISQNSAATPAAQTVTLTGNATIDVNGHTVTYANTIGNNGAGSLTVQSTAVGGVLNLSAASTYTGNTTIGANATLNVNNPGGSGTGAGNVTVNGILGGTGSVSGNVTVNSGGTYGLSGSVGGTLTLATGASALFNSSADATVTGAVTFNGNAVTVYVPSTPLPIGQYTLFTAPAGITGTLASNPTYTGAGPAGGTVSSLSFSGTTVVLNVVSSGVAGTWTDGDSTGDWSDALNWSGGLPHSAGDAATFGTGAGPVTLDASETVATLAFNNASSYVINGGNTLTLDNKAHGAAINVTAGNGNVINPAISLNDNLTTSVGSGDSLALNGNISSTSPGLTVAVTGSGTTILSGGNTYGPAAAGTAGTALSGGGTLQVANSSALGAGDLTVSSSPISSTVQAGVTPLTLPNHIALGSGTTVLDNNGGDNVILNGTISGGGSLSVVNSAGTGTGTVTLASGNSYSGNTTINAGTVLSISGDTSLGATPGSVTANDLILNGGDLLGNGTFALSANRGIGIGATAGSTGVTALIDAAGGAAVTINGVIASAGNTGVDSLTVNGSGGTGTVVLGGANTFTGNTTLGAGTLTLGNSLALQNSTLIYNSGVLSLGSLSAVTLGDLSGTMNLALPASAALTLGGNNASTTYSGGISGSSATLTKNGSGTLTLTGANTYTGATTINAGELEIPAGGSITSSILNGQGYLVDGGTVISTGSSSFNAVSPALSETSGTVSLGAVSQPSNAGDGQLITISGGVFSANSLSFERTASLTTAPTATAPVAAPTTAGLYVNGGNVYLGALSLSLENSSSSVRLDAGSLTVTNELLIGDMDNTRWTAVQINGGVFNATNTSVGVVLSEVNGTYANSSELYLSGGVSTIGKIAFGLLGDTAGAVGGTGWLIMNNAATKLYVGAGGIVQSNTANYSANISLLGGILGATANWSSALPMQLSGTSFVIQAADASGAPWNIGLSGGLTGAGELIMAGGGTITLGGANTYTGSTTVSNNGTLLVNGSLSASAVTVQSGASFGGSGTLGQAVTYATGADAVFAEGSPATFAGALTLDQSGAGTTVKLNLPASLGAGTYPLANYTAANLTGSFNATPAILSGGITPGATATVTTGASSLTLTVSQATPAISGSLAATALTYGQPLSASTVTGTVINANQVAIPGTFTFTSASTVLTAGTYTESVTFTPNDATDYTTIPGSVSVTVNPATPVISGSLTASGIVYGQTLGASTVGGTLINPASSAVVPGTFAFATPLAALAAGTYTESVTFTPGDATDYTTAPGSVSVTVLPAALTITANSTNIIYGSTVAFVGTEFTTAGLINGDLVTSATISSAGVATALPAGAYPITISAAAGTGLGNYAITYAPGTLTVQPALLGVTANNTNQVFGATNPVFTVTYTGFVNGDSVTHSDVGGAAELTSDAATNSPVGEYVITNKLGTLTSTNYTFTFTNGTLTVVPAALTVTANNVSQAYGAATPALTASYSGFVNGDTASVVSGAPSLSVDTTAASPVGHYDITASQGTLSAANYAFTMVGGTLTVTQANLTITASNATKIYGQTLSFAGTEFSAGGLQNSETVGAVTLTANGGTAVTDGVGAYTITPSAATGGTFNPDNYAITYAPGTLTVTPLPVTVTANAQTKVYGSADPALTYGFSPALVADDSFTGALGRTPGGTVGAYAINQNTLALSSNYTITYVGANLTVTPLPVTVTADSQFKVYGTADPALTYEFAPALVTGDHFTGALSRVAGENVGFYAITQNTLALSANYTLTYAGDDLEIFPASLTVTATNLSKPFGQTLTFAGTEFTTSGLLGTDTVTSATLASSGAVSTAALGSYPITVGSAVGSGVDNYFITYVNGTLTVVLTPVKINPPVVLADRTLQLTFTGGNATLSYEVQGSPDLFNWTTLTNETATLSGLPAYIDTGATNNVMRFYRTVKP
jgi:autotransporter-associated beta strand protein